jgi:hypothetical protein
VPLPVAELLSAADDDFIAARLSEYVRVLDDILARGL